MYIREILGMFQNLPFISHSQTDASPETQASSPEGISCDKQQIMRSELNQQTAARISGKALSIIALPLSPLLILGGAVVFGISKAASGKDSLWDKMMTRLILPSSIRKENMDKPPEAKKFEVEVKQGVKLDGMLLTPEGVDLKDASEYPCVVLFCPNGDRMEDRAMLLKAKDYQDHGYNVVMFNYRGVGESTGDARKCQDLLDDGEAVVKSLISCGIEIGTENESIKVHPKAEELLLDGHSIGGAVAIHVGSKYPQATLAASRTFTKWTDAAEELVKDNTNPAIGKIARGILKLSGRGNMDSAKKMEERLGAEGHTFTVIEVASHDQIIKGNARLTEAYMRREMGQDRSINGELSTQNFENVDHNIHIRLEDRTKLYEKVIKPNYEKFLKSQELKMVEKVIVGLRGNIEELNRISAEFKATDDPNEKGVLAREFVATNKKVREYLEEFRELSDEVKNSKIQDLEDMITNLEEIRDDDNKLLIDGLIHSISELKNEVAET